MMRLRFWRKESGAPPGGSPRSVEGPSGLPASLTTPISQRHFLKLVLGAVGGAGLGLAGAARPVQATYTAGSPSDTVDTNLTVQGNLIVTSGPNGPGNVGIGTTNPQGKLDVAGDIRVNGKKAVGSDGVAGRCYYTFTTGAWAIVGRHSWGECTSNNWSWQDLTTLTE